MAWFPESATEWKASASIEDAPVTRKPANLATAMPRLARSAATTAILPCPLPGLASGGVGLVSCVISSMVRGSVGPPLCRLGGFQGNQAPPDRTCRVRGGRSGVDQDWFAGSVGGTISDLRSAGRPRQALVLQPELMGGMTDGHAERRGPGRDQGVVGRAGLGAGLRGRRPGAVPARRAVHRGPPAGGAGAVLGEHAVPEHHPAGPGAAPTPATWPSSTASAR